MHKSGLLVPGSSSSFKTGSLQHTHTYTWNTADALGKGATAVVYFGRNKHTGDVCAVKVFHERISRYMSTTREREIESLRALQHDNIVKLLALETEDVTGHEVLVMEYCSGGSLYSMLEQPQYAFGFPEPEFKLFLKHIANGMHYLRLRGYVHRDIKPGNIMRYIAEDGRSLYKITDFGAARELQDDETFTSIYGTEEYLYPGMYEQAVLRRPGPQNFDASVDLWSLGVTIFHVATGFLPFQPYGGRSNSHTMHMITSKKPEGAISGIQSTLNGPIKWENNLPQTCHLSRQIQGMLVPMLAGLMEINLEKMWTFNMFFNNVSQLDSMMVFKMFLCCVADQAPIYVHQADTICKIQEKIAAETDIAAGHQLILWHDKQLCEVVEPSATANNYPKVIANTCLYVINKLSMESGSLKVLHVPPFPEIPMVENLEADATLSKKAAAIAFLMCTCIKVFLDQQRRIYKGELLFRRYLKRIVWHSEWIVPEIRNTLNETHKRQESFSKSFTVLLNLFKTLDSSLHVEELVTSKIGSDFQLRETVQHLSECLGANSLNEFYERIERQKRLCLNADIFDIIQTRYAMNCLHANEIERRLNEIEVYVDVLSRRITEQETDRLRQAFGCSEEDYCLSKAESLKQKIIAVHTTMSKHKKFRELHAHEQFIHKCEKQKLQEYCVSMWTLANDHCKKNLQQCFKAAQREFCNLTKHLTRTKKVEQNITSVKDSLNTLSDKLQEKESKCLGIVERITLLLESTLKSRKGGPSKRLAGTRESSPADGSEQAQPMECARKEEIRSELTSRESVTPESRSSGSGYASQPKRQRTEMLDKLATELMSLKTDSDELKHLVMESSDVMKQFLSETSNLHIEGSLDSDQRRYKRDDT